MSIKRIPTQYVTTGMYISDKTPGLGDAGLKTKGFVFRGSTADKIKSSELKELYIDTSKGEDCSHSLPIPEARAQYEPTVAFEEERENATRIYSEARDLIGDMVRHAKMGKAVEMEPVEELADDMCESLAANVNALLCLSQIREKDKYLLEHSINVGVLMGCFTRYLGYSRTEVHALVTGALLHDIGKIRVDSRILNKAGRLDDEEWQAMKRHVEYGEEVLKKSRGISSQVLNVCAEHHERMDGGGYPRGLAGDQITPAGRMASIVDIYDALTADRVYHNGKTPFDTMKVLVELAGDHLDRDLVYDFIRCMGVFPIGTLVKLSNEHLAVVQQTNIRRLEYPVVKMFYDVRLHKHEVPRVIDLSRVGIDLRIKSAIDPNKFELSVRDYI